MPFRFICKLVKNNTRNQVVAIGKYRRLDAYAFPDRAFDREAAVINYRCDILNDNAGSSF
jgi:hypothetical protein